METIPPPVPPGSPPAAPPGPPGEPRRRRPTSIFGEGGWSKRWGSWGFLAFVVLILVLARHVLLPFVFAALIAYILAPVIDRMSKRKDGKKRMPRGLAIILCYIVLIASIALFLVVLVPRLSSDIARIGKEAPSVYQKLNKEWAPKVARWLEDRFPSLKKPSRSELDAPVVPDVPFPPGTAFVVTPLPDGRFALQITPAGLHIAPIASGGYNIVPNEQPPESLSVEEMIRMWAGKSLAGLQSQLGGVVRFGQSVVTKVVKSVFTFFLILMVAAFLLLDLNKLHQFARTLVPQWARDDYEYIVAGMDKGLSGVIRGQLIICLVNGILTYIGLLIFSVKYSLILAVVAALLSLVPIFGALLSTIPIVLAALVSGDEGVDIARAIFAVAWIVGIHFLEANFLNPKIIGTAAKIHPVLVVFALILGEHTYGLVGALFAVPVLSMIQVLFVFFRKKAWRHDPETMTTGPTATIPAAPDPRA